MKVSAKKTKQKTQIQPNMGAGHAQTKGAQTRWDNNIKS